MAKPLGLDLEHPVRGEKAQGAGECVAIGADGRGQLTCCEWRVVQCIGDAQIGDDVKAPWQAVPPSNLLEDLHRMLGDDGHDLLLPLGG